MRHREKQLGVRGRVGRKRGGLTGKGEDGERYRASICWFTYQTPTMARARPGKSQTAGSQPRSATLALGIQLFELLPLFTVATLVGNLNQQRSQDSNLSTPAWDRGILINTLTVRLNIQMKISHFLGLWLVTSLLIDRLRRIQIAMVN